MISAPSSSTQQQRLRGFSNGRKFSIDVDAIGNNSFVGFASRAPANEYIKSLVNKSWQGMMSGYSPTLCEVGVGGTYFLKDSYNRRIGVFKPHDEEMGCHNNPKGYTPMSPGSIEYSRSRGVSGGDAAFRECAAYALDHDHFSGVPATELIACSYPGFHNSPTNNSHIPEENFKVGSFQEFKEHDFDTEDISPSKASRFPVNEVHKIALLDIRLFNTDRHGGNILVRKIHCTPKLRGISPKHARRYTDENEARDQMLFQLDMNSDEEDSSSRHKAEEEKDKEEEDEEEEEEFDDYDEDFSDMTFSLASSTSSTSSLDDADGVTYELIPIDHGYTLPSTITGLTDSWFEWLNWPQAKLPFSAETKEYIARLDVDRDIALLRSQFGEWLDHGCYKVLRITTKWLKLGSKLDLTPHELGVRMCRRRFDQPSDLEKIVAEVEENLAKEEAGDGEVGEEAEEERRFDVKLEECMKKMMEDVIAARSLAQPARRW